MALGFSTGFEGMFGNAPLKFDFTNLFPNGLPQQTTTTPTATTSPAPVTSVSPTTTPAPTVTTTPTPPVLPTGAQYNNTGYSPAISDLPATDLAFNQEGMNWKTLSPYIAQLKQTLPDFFTNQYGSLSAENINPQQQLLQGLISSLSGLGEGVQGRTQQDIGQLSQLIPGMSDITQQAGTNLQGLSSQSQTLTDQMRSQLAGLGSGLTQGSAAGLSNIDQIRQLIQQQGTGAGNLYDPYQQQLQALNQNAANVSATGLTDAQTGTSDIAGYLQNIGTGQVDPRYQAVADAQIAQIAQQQKERQMAQDEFFSRRGISGTSAALNAQNRLASQFDLEKQSAQSNLALQGLQRGDVALQNALGARGQQAQLGLAGGEFARSGINQQTGLVGQQAGLTTTGQSLASQLLGQAAGLSGQGLNQQQTLAQLQAGLLGQGQAATSADLATRAGLSNQLFSNTQQNAMNTANLANLRSGLNLQGTQLLSQLGTQQAGFGQQGIENLIAQLSSGNQALEGTLGLRSTGLENLLTPYSLETGRISATEGGSQFEDAINALKKQLAELQPSGGGGSNVTPEDDTRGGPNGGGGTENKR